MAAEGVTSAVNELIKEAVLVAVREELAAHKEEVDELRHTFTTVKGEFTAIKRVLAVVKGELAKHEHAMEEKVAESSRALDGTGLIVESRKRKQEATADFAREEERRREMQELNQLHATEDLAASKEGLKKRNLKLNVALQIKQSKGDQKMAWKVDMEEARGGQGGEGLERGMEDARGGEGGEGMEVEGEEKKDERLEERQERKARQETDKDVWRRKEAAVKMGCLRSEGDAGRRDKGKREDGGRMVEGARMEKDKREEGKWAGQKRCVKEVSNKEVEEVGIVKEIELKELGGNVQDVCGGGEEVKEVGLRDGERELVPRGCGGEEEMGEEGGQQGTGEAQGESGRYPAGSRELTCTHRETNTHACAHPSNPSAGGNLLLSLLPLPCAAIPAGSLFSLT
ncbi:unnamed protein product [Closterium sp. NIES-65]|nr:unnamed protein product [Closterium sp. NIES-65]